MYERSRRMLNTVVDVTRKEKTKRTEGFNNIKERTSHLHKQVIWNSISLAYGPD